jgi:hypothetical protein
MGKSGADLVGQERGAFAQILFMDACFLGSGESFWEAR